MMRALYGSCLSYVFPFSTILPPILLSSTISFAKEKIYCKYDKKLRYFDFFGFVTGLI